MAPLPLDKEQWKIFTTKILDNLNTDENEDVRKKVTDIFEGKSEAVAPYPRPPTFTQAMSVVEKVLMIQTFLNQLQYNHTGTQFFVVKMNRSISRLYDVAKDIIRNPLPIKCLEAVAVALYLTTPINSLERFTIRFKSQYGKDIHRHIVLGLYHNSQYGALGLSRRKCLMYKAMEHVSLADLILDFRDSYESCCHSLKKVKISLPIGSDLHSVDTISWNHFVLPMGGVSDDRIRSSLATYSRELRTKFRI